MRKIRLIPNTDPLAEGEPYWWPGMGDYVVITDDDGTEHFGSEVQAMRYAYWRGRRDERKSE